ncbi:hypothetical protein BDW74DRAFT_58895 [Aspergillus multicolor]|uniref:uncharacterized protein n=1 Tax=Aspergillus multicolor TaxID=41759 RepID=UPI003CCDF80D
MGLLQSFKLLYVSVSILLLSSLAHSSYLPQLEILYWRFGQAEPSVLAHVSYDLATLKSDLIDYYPPIELSPGLVRLGFYAATPTNPQQWVGTLVSPLALTGQDASQRPILRLHVSPSNEIYHVSLDPTTTVSTYSSGSILVELVANELGPSPHLNRPIVVGPDGKSPEEQPEKTLFQKYWWVFLIVTFLAMSGGGEQQ